MKNVAKRTYRNISTFSFPFGLIIKAPRSYKIATSKKLKRFTCKSYLRWDFSVQFRRRLSKVTNWTSAMTTAAPFLHSSTLINLSHTLATQVENMTKNIYTYTQQYLYPNSIGRLPDKD